MDRKYNNSARILPDEQGKFSLSVVASRLLNINITKAFVEAFLDLSNIISMVFFVYFVFLFFCFLFFFFFFFNPLISPSHTHKQI